VKLQRISDLHHPRSDSRYAQPSCGCRRRGAIMQPAVLLVITICVFVAEVVPCGGMNI
jgi:hypothetical protein